MRLPDEATRRRRSEELSPERRGVPVVEQGFLLQTLLLFLRPLCRGKVEVVRSAQLAVGLVPLVLPRRHPTAAAATITTSNSSVDDHSGRNSIPVPIWPCRCIILVGVW